MTTRTACNRIDAELPIMGWTKHFDEQHAPDDGEATDFDWPCLLARLGSFFQ